MIQLSERVKSTIRKVANQNASSIRLDPTEADDLALITEILVASNKTPDRYPALHRAITLAKGNSPTTREPNATIIDLGRDSRGRATTRCWVASPGYAFISGATTMVLDPDGAVLASGTATQVGGTLVQAATRSADARPATKKLTHATFFHSQQTPDTAPTFGLLTKTQTTNENTLVPLVTEPVQSTTKGKGPNIVIAVARDTSHQNPDSDYAYPQSVNQDPDRLVVPFIGNCDLLQTITATQQNPIVVTTQLYVLSAKAFLNPLSTFDLQAGLTPSGSVLSWSYPYDGQPVMYTQSIQYEANSQANDTQTAFFFQFTVPVDNPIDPTVTFTVCSPDWPQEPSINCKVIEDIQYWWHCVAEGTRVTLADGSQVTIDRVDNTVSVRTAQGSACPVQATSRARHDASDALHPMIRLRMKGGRDVLLSDAHPVVTPDGLTAARDLKAGDTVVTDTGDDQIASAGPESYGGLVYNLLLAPGSGHDFGSYLANGIAVGDHGAQAAHDRAKRQDPKYMLARIPQSHHADWQSALADSKALV